MTPIILFWHTPVIETVVDVQRLKSDKDLACHIFICSIMISTTGDT